MSRRRRPHVCAHSSARLLLALAALAPLFAHTRAIPLPQLQRQPDSTPPQPPSPLPPPLSPTPSSALPDPDPDPAPQPQQSQPRTRMSRTVVIVGGSMAAVLLVGILSFVFVCYSRIRNARAKPVMPVASRHSDPTFVPPSIETRHFDSLERRDSVPWGHPPAGSSSDAIIPRSSPAVLG